MIYDIIIFIVALAVLVKASDFLVESAAKLAKAVGVSEFVIGMTLVAFGTSLPELVSSVAAAAYKNSGLILGNILGSNIANIGLIVGIGAMIAPIMIEKRMFRREGLFLLAVSILFYALAFNRIISLAEGIIFLLIFAAYLLYLAETDVFDGALTQFFVQLIRAKAKDGITGLKNHYKNYMAGLAKKNGKSPGLKFIATQAAIIIASSIALYFSSKYLIPAAHNLALAIRVPDSIIGVTLLAIGTSLPELSVTIAAVRKGKGNLLVGNILGSNIANILLIIGISSIMTPLTIVSGITFYYFFPAMILMVLLLLAFIRTNWIVRMFEGVILLMVYAVFIAVLLYIIKTGIWAQA